MSHHCVSPLCLPHCVSPLCLALQLPCLDPPLLLSERAPPPCFQELRSPLLASLRAVTVASNSLGLFHARKVVFTSNRSRLSWTATHQALDARSTRGEAVASKFPGLAPGREWDGPSEALLKRGFGVARAKLVRNITG